MVSAQALEFINCKVLNLIDNSTPFQILVVEEEENATAFIFSLCLCYFGMASQIWEQKNSSGFR